MSDKTNRNPIILIARARKTSGPMQSTKNDLTNKKNGDMTHNNFTRDDDSDLDLLVDVIFNRLMNGQSREEIFQDLLETHSFKEDDIRAAYKSARILYNDQVG
jgi:hypothetical protein